MLREQSWTVTCDSAGAGVSTGSGSSPRPISGMLKAILLDHSAAGAATTDATVKSGGRTIMTKSDSATDATFYPMVQGTGSDGAAIAGAYKDQFSNDYMTLELAQANSGQTCTITVIYDDLVR